MIIKGLFELVYTLLNVVLTPFQIVPDMPTFINDIFEYFFNFIFTPINILMYFTDVTVIRTLIPLYIVVLNMEHIWDGIMWILKKLPFVGIE